MLTQLTLAAWPMPGTSTEQMSRCLLEGGEARLAGCWGSLDTTNGVLCD